MTNSARGGLFPQYMKVGDRAWIMRNPATGDLLLPPGSTDKTRPVFFETEAQALQFKVLNADWLDPGLIPTYAEIGPKAN